jgi:hypothetical protein
MGATALLGLLRLNYDVGLGPVNVALFGLLFGPGLFMRRPWARKVLIALTYLGFAIEFLFLVGALQWSPRSFRIGLFFIIVTVALLIVQLTILMSRDVRKFFDPRSVSDALNK